MKHGVHHSPLVLPRSFAPDTVRIATNGGVIEEYDAIDFCSHHHFDALLRILNHEYASIDHRLPYFTHFNLEFGGHKIGSKVVLPRIVRRGYFRSPDDEVIPVLSFKNVYCGTVVRKREHIPYESLQSEIFKYSMKHIQNSEQLAATILERYQTSMPLLSKAEILERGVGMTTIRLEEIFETAALPI